MKLAEALLLRADMQKEIASLKERIVKNVLYQEGEQPSEDPNELIKKADAVAAKLCSLVNSINEANLSAKTARNRTITATLAERDNIITRLTILHTAVASAVKPPERYGAKEIRWIKAIDVPALQKEIDSLSKQLREINGEIQAANWTIEIAEI